MITIIFANPDGFENKEFKVNEALSALLALEEKDIYIDHAPVEQQLLSEKLLEDASHIMVQDKLIGA